MNQREFMEYFTKIAKRYKFKVYDFCCIRGKDNHCPLSAVAVSKGFHSVNPCNAVLAQSKLGISEELRHLVVTAADGFVKTKKQKAIRNNLLKACGIDNSFWN